LLLEEIEKLENDTKNKITILDWQKKIIPYARLVYLIPYLILTGIIFFFVSLEL
jgi:hypothetical protein